MNETMSLLLATAILAIGGIGLYMYKTENDSHDDNDSVVSYNDDDFIDTKHTDYEEEDYEPEIYEPKVRSRSSKTKRQRKTGGTKRRY